MKVVLLCLSDRTGGAAVVTHRLMNALREAHVDARMIVCNKSSDDVNVMEVGSPDKRLFLAERGVIFMHNGFNRQDLFKVSIANTGLHLEKHPWIVDADVIVINWINQGMLSLKGIERLARLGKPLVWTMHDMWCLTGICHHAHECWNYKHECGNCYYLHRCASDNDISHKVWKKKKRLYDSVPIHFVAVSNWLADCCRESSLLSEKPVSVIHNAFPIDSFIINPITQSDFGIDYGKKLIIMGAARLDDPIKGFGYAIDALNCMVEKYPDIANDCEAVFFGDIRDASLLQQIKMDYHYVGRISNPDVLRNLYASSAVVLSTSLYETLPGTLIEGQASGCVPVSFGKGGQADIIDHKNNGYIADYKSAESIADGIVWALQNAPAREVLHEEVRRRFSANVIAHRYIELFNNLLRK